MISYDPGSNPLGSDLESRSRDQPPCLPTPKVTLLYKVYSVGKTCTRERAYTYLPIFFFHKFDRMVAGRLHTLHKHKHAVSTLQLRAPSLSLAPFQIGALSSNALVLCKFLGTPLVTVTSSHVTGTVVTKFTSAQTSEQTRRR